MRSTIAGTEEDGWWFKSRSSTAICLSSLSSGKHPWSLRDHTVCPPHSHIKHATRAGNQRYRAEFGFEGGEQLLRRPAGPQEPAAAGAIFNFDTWGHGIPLYRIEAFCRCLTNTIWHLGTI